MRAAVLRRVIEVAGRPVDAGLRRRRSGPTVVILIYHRIGGRSPSAVDLERQSFAHQLDGLVESGRVIALDHAVDLVKGPPSASVEVTDDELPFVVLTFDDGTADWVDEALPELVDRSLPATFYVSTDFVERSRPFPDGGTPISWSALRELASSGLATIGSHTHTHRVLAGATAAVARDEIDRSVGLLEGQLGVACDHFAYPKAIAPSAAAEQVVRRRFISAALAGNRVNTIGRTDPHRLGRHGLTNRDDDDAFTRKSLGGVWLEGWMREQRDAFAVRRLDPTA